MDSKYKRWLSRLKVGDTIWIDHVWQKAEPTKATITRIVKRPTFTHIHTDMEYIVREIGRCTTRYDWARKTREACQ